MITPNVNSHTKKSLLFLAVEHAATHPNSSSKVEGWKLHAKNNQPCQRHCTMDLAKIQAKPEATSQKYAPHISSVRQMRQ